MAYSWFAEVMPDTLYWGRLKMSSRLGIETCALRRSLTIGMTGRARTHQWIANTPILRNDEK